jgi:hypothetical protein
MNIEQKVIKNKVGLLNLAQSLGNVSQACKVLGFSRDSFYLSFAKTLSGHCHGFLTCSYLPKAVLARRNPWSLKRCPG